MNKTAARLDTIPPDQDRTNGRVIRAQIGIAAVVGKDVLAGPIQGAPTITEE